MEYVVQVIMIIVCIAVVVIVMYFCCTKCRHTHTIFKYYFPFLPISRIIHTSRHTDLFVEVTNVTKGNGIWAHFALTGCFPSQIQMSRPIQKEDVQIETICCTFKCIRINWLNINVTGISGTMITCTIPVPIIVLYLCRTLVSNLNSTEFHLQGVAPRSQYSDPMPEAVTLQ